MQPAGCAGGVQDPLRGAPAEKQRLSLHQFAVRRGSSRRFDTSPLKRSAAEPLANTSNVVVAFVLSRFMVKNFETGQFMCRIPLQDKPDPEGADALAGFQGLKRFPVAATLWPSVAG